MTSIEKRKKRKREERKIKFHKMLQILSLKMSSVKLNF
jgi:hypothetical protein